MEEADASAVGLIKTPGYIADRVRVVNPLWASFLEMESYDPVSNKMLLMEKYELAFGIQPRINPSPISLVTMNEATDLMTDGLYERTVNKLIKYEVPEVTGMNIQQLMDLPTYKLKAIMRSITAMRLSKAKPKSKGAAKDLKQALDEFQ